MEKVRATSWSGSEDSRREQGVCLPPKRQADKTPRFSIEVGSRCQVAKVITGDYFPYTTKTQIGFERFERYRDGVYTFRQDEYLVKVHRSNVTHREDANA